LVTPDDPSTVAGVSLRVDAQSEVRVVMSMGDAERRLTAKEAQDLSIAIWNRGLEAERISRWKK
jgi:hypothetical protein